MIIASAICCISFGIHQAVNVEESLNGIFDEPDKYISLAEACYWQMVFNSALAITLFLAWIKVLQITIVAVFLCINIDLFQYHMHDLVE